MNSLIARNAALVLIGYLLWFVLSGIYGNHVQQTIAREDKQFKQQQTAHGEPATRAAKNSNLTSDERRLTADDIRQIAMYQRLPSWVKNSPNKHLSLEEVEEIVSTGRLPSSKR